MTVVVENEAGGRMKFEYPLLEIWRGYQVGGTANAVKMNRMGEQILDERDWVGATAIDSKGRLFELVDARKTPGIGNLLRTAFPGYRYRMIWVNRRYRYLRTMTLNEMKEYIIDKIMATPEDQIGDPFVTSPERINALREKRSLAEFMASFDMSMSMGPVDYILTRIGL